MSTTGVPSIASSGPTFSLRPAISRTVTRCNPEGFGLSGDMVPKTPVSGRLFTSLGCSVKRSRRASCNQVTTMISWPTSIPWCPSTRDGASSIHSSGFFVALAGRRLAILERRLDNTDRLHQIRAEISHLSSVWLGLRALLSEVLSAVPAPGVE
jgi:hypothetical protein